MTAYKKLIFSGVAAIVAIGVGSWYALHLAGRGDDSLHVSGNIEAIEVAISFKIPGRVDKRHVDEGELVYAGKPVAQLETADLQADLALHHGELQAAEAALAELVAGSRPDEIAASLAAMQKAQANYAALKTGSRSQEIAASEAEFRAAEADREHLKGDLDRAEKLQRTSPGAITPEQFDLAYAAYRMANSRYLQAMKRYEMVKEGPRQEDVQQGKAAMEQAQAQYRLIKDGPRKEVIHQALAKVQQAKAAVQAAETRLGYATVNSPLTGVVLSKNIEPGEYVAPGTPVVTVADIENVWLRAYIDERDLGKRNIALGTEAEITTDAYPGKVYQGRVSFISSEQEFTPKAVQTNRERVKFVYRIKIDLKNPDKELKPGMPADARIGKSEIRNTKYETNPKYQEGK
ncbi:MAG: efflux RND transporter periplasmic adaptor subunit [Planctomycetota bacterium]